MSTINREALRRAEALTNAFGYHNVIDTIRELPTAEKVGKWVKAKKGGEWWYACSICSSHIPKTLWGQDWHSSYCPNCGARMEDEQGEV